MGVANLGGITVRLMAGGLDPSTPAAVVERGTLPGQRTVVGTLGSIAGLAVDVGVTSPAICVVGEVVALYGQIGLKAHLPELAGAVVV
jgi:siroheme synthase